MITQSDRHDHDLLRQQSRERRRFALLIMQALVFLLACLLCWMFR